MTLPETQHEIASRADALAARRDHVRQGILEHKTQRAIARELGVSVSVVNGDIKALRLEWQRARLEAVDTIADEELQRLAAIEATLWPSLTDSNLSLANRLAVVDRLLKIQERRAKLLGTDEAPEVDVETWIRDRLVAQGFDPGDVEAAVRQAEAIIAEHRA